MKNITSLWFSIEIFNTYILVPQPSTLTKLRPADVAKLRTRVVTRKCEHRFATFTIFPCSISLYIFAHVVHIVYSLWRNDRNATEITIRVWWIQQLLTLECFEIYHAITAYDNLSHIHFIPHDKDILQWIFSIERHLCHFNNFPYLYFMTYLP